MADAMKDLNLISEEDKKLPEVIKAKDNVKREQQRIQKREIEIFKKLFGAPSKKKEENAENSTAVESAETAAGTEGGQEVVEASKIEEVKDQNP